MSLRPPFTLAEATLFTAPDRLVTFADRYDDPLAVPPIRPARYEGTSAWLMRIAPAGPNLALRWPCSCEARTVDLRPGGPVAALLELAPLPFALRNAFAAVAGGVPTFYLAYESPAFPEDHQAVRPAEPPISTSGAWLGIVFQDRIAAAPWLWFDRLAAAPGASPEWRDWAEAFAGRRAPRLLDGTGRPLAGERVTVTRAGASQTLVADAAGALPGVGEGDLLAWNREEVSEAPLPLIAVLDSGAANLAGENRLIVPGGSAGAHIELLDLADWLAPNRHADPLRDALGARFRRASRMEPLVDGDETFARLLADLGDANGPEAAAYFAGWAFKDFPMRPGDDDTRLDRIAARIVGDGGDVRVLAAQFVQASDEALESLGSDAALIFFVLVAVGNAVAIGTTSTTGYTGPVGLGLWTLLANGGLALLADDLATGVAIGKALRKKAEQTSPEYLAKLAAACRAIYTPHPVRMADNPLADDIPLPNGRTIGELQDRWGIFHQKIQLVKRQSAGPDRYSAYVGGIDVNTNRLDSPGHHGTAWQEPAETGEPRPNTFHDVHCRLTGAAAAEVFHIFRGREELAFAQARAAGETVLPPPPVLPAPDEWRALGRHVIQVASTAYLPAPGGEGLPWAPDGDRTTHDTFVRAIHAAREHIYIEEQYMVPSEAYMEALESAAGHCCRLVILLPTFLEVYFGDRKRGAFFDRLAQAWGERLFIGTPIRRPVLAPTGRTTSKGRCTLMRAVDGAASAIVVGPAGRVPGGRFFVWVEGELMYVVAQTSVIGDDGQPAKELQVLRGGNGTARRWCPDPRPHAFGAPVTAAQPVGIFLHSKIMMVDDLFVAIGSTNINRRGFFHDGEVTAFAIPEELRNAADNPARDLRCRLWGEQLGLAPSLGAALFRDPVAGFELFRRSRYAGNRVVPLGELAVPVPTLNDLPDLIEKLPPFVSNLIQFTVQNALEPFGQDIFNTLSDPTTALETVA